MPRHLPSWLISGIALLLAAAPLKAEPALLGAPPILRQFGDWMLACDNVRVCRAQVRSYDSSLMIRYDPGPNGTILVVLDGQDPSDGPSVPNVDSISVDGRIASAPWQLDLEEENARLEGAAAIAFVRLIADAHILRYLAGGQQRSVSLDGLRAALLAMDEAQGRLGTVTALARPGRRPAAAVPSAHPVPSLSIPRPPATPIPASFVAQVRQASGQLLRRADCEANAHAINQDQAHALNDADALVMLGCRPYPSNFGYLLLRVPRTDPRRAQAIILPQLPEIDAYEDGTGEYPSVDWDAGIAQLTSMNWSCAHTCGTNITWAFDGRSFILAEYMTYASGGYEGLHLYRTIIGIRR